MKIPKNIKEAWLIYDGDCPFCSSYVKYLRVKDSVGQLHLSDARKGGELVNEVSRKNLNLDEGLVLKIGENFYLGEDAVHVLSFLSTSVGIFNRVNGIIFRSQKLSKILYPSLRIGRNVTLRILGRKKINNLM